MRLPDSLLDDCLCDPSAPLGHDPARDYGLGKPQAQTQLAGLKEWLREQQSMLMANRQDALLLVLQGPDCAGKNGVVRRVLAGLDPLGMSAIDSGRAPRGVSPALPRAPAAPWHAGRVQPQLLRGAGQRCA